MTWFPYSEAGESPHIQTKSSSEGQLIRCGRCGAQMRTSRLEIEGRQDRYAFHVLHKNCHKDTNVGNSGGEDEQEL